MQKYTNLNDIKSQISRKTYIGSGTTAKIYKYGDYIIKLFNNKGLEKERYEYLQSIHNETFLFPDSLIIYNGKIIGYMRKYINGIIFDKMPYNHDLNWIKSNLNKIDNDTIKISKNGIRILDLSGENIILDSNNSIKVIDTDEFGLYYNYGLENLSYENLLSIRKQIFKYLFNTRSIKNVDNMDLSTLEIIKKIIIEYSNKYNIDIDTVTKLRYISSIENHLSLI